MFEQVKTPCYVVDEKKLKENLSILKDVEQQSGARILLAQKAFSMYSLYPLMGKYLSGTTASGLYEARLGYEEMGKENHVFAPAYKKEDVRELAKICDHMVFNSFSQYETYKGMCGGVSLGIRVNPCFSTQKAHAIYDPCGPFSRLGVTLEQFPPAPDFGEGGLEGIHFHTLCEQDAEDLIATFQAVEEQFGKWLPKVKWINMGGGHHITREDYHRGKLISFLREVKEKYKAEIYLEPGEAVALNAGYLVTEVMDKVENSREILILDASAACHMPDVLEMPYRPPLKGGYEPGEKPYTYRLSSLTCLAGDVIGDYSFEKEISIGDRLVFEDMAIYSMVKNNTFNGIPLPDICLLKENGEIETVKHFGYEDFKGRLS